LIFLETAGDLDPTVDSGVEALHRICIDDVDDPTEEAETLNLAAAELLPPESHATSSSDESANKSNESFNETLSADSSILKEAGSGPEDDLQVFFPSLAGNNAQWSGKRM
jgi:hypothetical protein